MTHRIGVLAFVFVAVVATNSLAGSWSDRVSYKYNNLTSLKIVEPDGFKVVVAMPDGSEKVGTIPEVFNLPDQDAFVKVTIVPTDGSASWSKKIEVKNKQQAELVVTFKADGPKGEPAKAGRSYVGRFANQVGGCGKGFARTIKVDFLNADGVVTKNAQIDSSKNVDVEVPGGQYDLRVYIWNDTEWKFVITSSHQIAKDGWHLTFGCERGSTKAVIIGG